MGATQKTDFPAHWLLFILLGLSFVSPKVTAISAYGASFISNPSIYAYSVENQQAPRENRDNIKFADDDGNLNANSNLNRNYYFTDDPSPVPNSNANPAASLATPPATQPAPQTGCTLDRLAVYKVVLHTYWTRELFPKHYPDWRPTAQWTKTLGESIGILFISPKGRRNIKMYEFNIIKLSKYVLDNLFILCFQNKVCQHFAESFIQSIFD